MLPRIGQKAGGPGQSPAGSRGNSAASAGPTGKYSRSNPPRSANVEVTDSESDLDESTDEELVKAQRSRSAAIIRRNSAEDGNVPRALSRGNPASAQKKRVDRAVVRETTRPVATQQQVFDMSRKGADLSDSTGDESDGDAEGRRYLQHAQLQRESSRASQPAAEYEAGTVRSKYGVKVRSTNRERPPPPF